MKTNIRIALTLVFAAVMVAFSACHKTNKDVIVKKNYTEFKVERGVLVDNSALDGCKWMIKLDNGAMLNPTNLVAMGGDKLVDGRKVAIQYDVQDGVMTTCMSGKVVSLTFLKID
ncbi:MAG: hypothetical protein M0D57_03650 [Sphingobacteriales bacterium JAD_PAG50586_3]|nr:MAG: hypothetical protein M0D57_03650 [Sphingobacteriales bacterium JAD_PAG50586_3]